MFGGILMIAEVYTRGFGAIGGTGLVCIVIGSLLLVSFQTGRWLISPEWYTFFLTLIGVVALVLGAFTLFVPYKIVKARRRRPVIAELIGETVEAVDEITQDRLGFVKYGGEYWRARSQTTLKPGMIGAVVGKEGPVLMVEPKGMKKCPQPSPT